MLPYGGTFVILFFGVVISGFVLAATTSSEASYRLPREVVPVHYDLLVNTNLDDDGQGFSFDGVVNVTVRPTDKLDSITLHTKNLAIDEGNTTVLELDSLKPLQISSIEYDIPNDFMIVHLGELLNEEKLYRLSIPFAAELKADVIGYYRSSYLDSESQQRSWLSVTQFQAIHARRAFPCFDEPELKATFNVSLGHHRKYNALSNMPLARTETSTVRPNWIVDHFEQSVLMAPYLVAYSINDYGFAEASAVEGNGTGIAVRSWSRRDAVGNLRYANQIALQLIDLYERTFDLQFPLPKLDFISVPDMLFAAMENWGLVTFTEAGLEYSATSSTVDDQHFVASVVAHEIAHMWFGNLVTMRWWTDLWLNEGFARYTEFKAVDVLHPEWRTMEDIVVEDSLEIFKFDALNSSHRVSIAIGNPEEIPQLFDSISYKKGAAVVRMMNLFLGDETYNKGVAEYLKRFQFGNAQQDDLWRSLTEAANESGNFAEGFDVKTVMDTWTLQTGYPVVYVKRDYDSRTATFSQMRFIYDETIDDPACWWIPLTISMAVYPNFNETQPQLWLGCSAETTPVITGLPCSSQWIMLNHQLAGLYKIQYDHHNYRLLSDQLNSPDYQIINTINRAQLIDDALDFAWAGIQDYSIAFSLLNYLSSDQEYIPWKAALTNLEMIDRVLVDSDHYNLFLEYLTHLLLPLYQKLNIFDTNFTASSRLGQLRLRKLTIDWACNLELDDCVQSSLDLFSEWMTNGSNRIPLELRSTVYCTAVRMGSRPEWDFLWARYRDPEVVSAERFGIAEGLACTSDAELMQMLLRWSIDEQSGLRLEETTVVFHTIAERSSEGMAMTKQFLFDNIDKMADYVNPETFESRLASHVKVLAQRITTRPELDQLEQFVALKQSILAGNSIAIQQALELARINIQWMENQQAGFVAYLQILARNGFEASKLKWF